MPDETRCPLKCPKCGEKWESMTPEIRDFFTGGITERSTSRVLIRCPNCYFFSKLWDFINYLFPKAFICHIRKDKEIASRLGKDLLSQGIDVWFDEWGMYPGDSIIGGIERGLENCSHLLILISKYSTKSNWVQEEVRSAMHRRIESGTPVIIPVLLDRCKVPQLLRGLKRVDISKDYNQALDQIFLGIKRPMIKPRLNIPGL